MVHGDQSGLIWLAGLSFPVKIWVRRTKKTPRTFPCLPDPYLCPTLSELFSSSPAQPTQQIGRGKNFPVVKWRKSRLAATKSLAYTRFHCQGSLPKGCDAEMHPWKSKISLVKMSMASKSLNRAWRRKFSPESGIYLRVRSRRENGKRKCFARHLPPTSLDRLDLFCSVIRPPSGKSLPSSLHRQLSVRLFRWNPAFSEAFFVISKKIVGWSRKQVLEVFFVFLISHAVLPLHDETLVNNSLAKSQVSSLVSRRKWVHVMLIKVRFSFGKSWTCLPWVLLVFIFNTALKINYLHAILPLRLHGLFSAFPGNPTAKHPIFSCSIFSLDRRSELRISPWPKKSAKLLNV